MIRWSKRPRRAAAEGKLGRFAVECDSWPGTDRFYVLVTVPGGTRRLMVREWDSLAEARSAAEQFERFQWRPFGQ